VEVTQEGNKLVVPGNAELAAALSRLLAVATHFNGLPERKRNSARCSALSALSSMAKQTSP
jgi:hypothetical protein